MNNLFEYRFDFEDLSSFLPKQKGKTAVVCDTNSLQHCWPKIGSNPALQDAEIIEIEPGEESKSLEVAANLWQTLVELKFDRRDTLICLGGGVITDLGGFIGATYKRGINTFHIPTSLLGMVDASIGGKTGINFQGLKNQIGTFERELKTLIFPQFLDTLPQEELLSGFAEMIKHGALDSAQHLDQLKNLDSVNAESISSLVEQSARFKERIVTLDFQESGARQQLNFGHTVGHAIEAITHARNQPLSHGHCVALGMIVELNLHENKSKNFLKLKSEVNQLISAFFDKSPLAAITTIDLTPYLLHDKKNQGDSIMMTKLDGIGTYAGVTPVNLDNLAQALSEPIE